MAIDHEILGGVSDAWARAVANPTLPAWHSVYIMAGGVATMIGKESPDSLVAAAVYGISEAARERAIALQLPRDA